MKSIAVILLVAFAVSASCKELFAVIKSEGTIAQLSDKFVADGYDVRGSHVDFILLVETVTSAPAKSVKLFNYDPAVFTYAVVVQQQLDFTFVETTFLNLTLAEYSVAIRGHYVVAVENENYEAFVGALPFNFEVVMVPETAVAKAFQMEVDHSTTALYNEISEKLRSGAPNPLVNVLIGAVTSADLQGFATILSGEASDIFSRQSQSVWAVQAQNYIESQFRFYGFNASRHFFRAGYSENVIGNWPGVGDASRLVLITAHYDSRSANSGSTTARAPGANDNGSGTTAILQIAKILNLHPLYKAV